MTTTFHKLKAPFTSARLTVGGGHTTLGLWVNHAKIGDVTLRNEEVPPVLKVLASEYEAVIRMSTGLIEKESVGLDQTLVSEYGELTTIQELREAANG